MTTDLYRVLTEGVYLSLQGLELQAGAPVKMLPYRPPHDRYSNHALVTARDVPSIPNSGVRVACRGERATKRGARAIGM